MNNKLDKNDPVILISDLDNNELTILQIIYLDNFVKLDAFYKAQNPENNTSMICWNNAKYYAEENKAVIEKVKVVFKNIFAINAHEVNFAALSDTITRILKSVNSCSKVA